MKIKAITDLDKRSHTEKHGRLVEIENGSRYQIWNKQPWAKEDDVEIIGDEPQLKMKNLTRKDSAAAKQYTDER